MEDAEFHCKSGLDPGGMKMTFFNDTKGWNDNHIPHYSKMIVKSDQNTVNMYYMHCIVSSAAPTVALYML